MRDGVRRIDGDLPLYFVQTIAEIAGQNACSLRLFREMVGLFAMIALVLASVGLYGVTAHSVVERTNEIGIRMALSCCGGSSSTCPRAIQSGSPPSRCYLSSSRCSHRCCRRRAARIDPVLALRYE